MSTLSNYAACYLKINRNALTNGTMLDEHGKKLSKSKKNYKPLNEVLDVYGGDVLRYFILNSPIVNGSDTLFSEKYLIEARKEFFLILWNSLKYFVSYANIHEFKPELGYPKLDEKNEFYLLDNWLLVKYKELFHSVNVSLTVSQKNFSSFSMLRILI